VKVAVKKVDKKEPSIRYNKPTGEYVKTWTIQRINCIWTKNVHPGRFHSMIFKKKKSLSYKNRN